VPPNKCFESDKHKLRSPTLATLMFSAQTRRWVAGMFEQYVGHVIRGSIVDEGLCGIRATRASLAAKIVRFKEIPLAVRAAPA
jgi:hypothetical protein